MNIKVVLKVIVTIYELHKIWKTVFFIFDIFVLFYFIEILFLCVCFSFSYFFFHWNFSVIAMKTNVFCICYEAAALVQRDKSEYKGSFEGVRSGI